MTRKLYVIYLVVLTYTIAINGRPSSQSQLSDEMTVIMDRFCEVNRMAYKDSLIDAYLSLLNDDGSFKDIDYQSSNVVYWDPIYHLDRLKEMAYAYTTPGNTFFDNQSLFDKIESGISYWYEANLVSDNWWYWAIAEPQRVGSLFIVLRHGSQSIPSDLEKKMLIRCKDRAGKPTSGAVNITDMALANMYQALLLEDSELLQTSVDYMKSAIAYAPNMDGFQYDNSYHSHGDQLYIGGYGVNHLLALTAVGSCIADTEFDFQTEQKEILSLFVRNTLANCIRGQVILYNCIGRNIARLNDLKFTSRFSLIAKRMQSIDPENKVDYESFLSRILGDENSKYGVESNNFYYATSDFALHVRPEYTFSVRMSSVNTLKPERGNGENLLGYYLGDGATCIAQSGEEYYNIMPLWDWDMIPGTTTPIQKNIPSVDNWGIKGCATFCGGVSDTASGIASFSYFDENPVVLTGASKSWFMFDDKIVCLGAGLKSEYDLRTTVEQSWGDESFSLLSSQGKNTYDGNVTIVDVAVDGICHKGIVYYFPMPTNINISNNIKSGNWRTISNEQPDSVLTGKVFTLSINHQKENTFRGEEKYAYAIYPTIDKTNAIENICLNPGFEIIVNSDSIQVIRDGSGDYGVVFFKGCDFVTDSYHFTATKPCIYLLKTELGGAFLCDPLKNADEISITLKTPELGISSGTIYFNDNDLYTGVTKFVQLQNTATGAYKKAEAHAEFHPSEDGIRLLLDNNGLPGTVGVYTPAGEKLYKKVIKENSVFLKLHRGIYIVTVTSNVNTFFKKLIVK